MDKKNSILGSALRLFVENGFHGTATSKIAQEASIANGTLFNYFKTKEELIVTLYHYILKDRDDFIIERISNLLKSNHFKVQYDVRNILNNPLNCRKLV